MLFLGFVIAWAVVGFFNWGFTLGYFSHHFPHGQHVAFAASFAVAGPIAFFPIVLCSWLRHWRITPLTVEERWLIFHKTFPPLSREYFEHHYN